MDLGLDIGLLTTTIVHICIEQLHYLMVSLASELKEVNPTPCVEVIPLIDFL